MPGRFRWGLLLGGLAVSAALTALLWWLTGGLALLLFLPFLFGVGFLRGHGPRPAAAGRCPRCRHLGAPGDAYCPRDGTPLGAS